jgi:DNA-binding transcriptional LysR family regulator
VVERRLRVRADVVAGTVRVATVYSVGLHTLPPTIIKRCLADHPSVNMRLSYRRTNEVYAACLDGDVDFGIVALPARRPQLAIVPLGYDELVIAAPPSHPVARRACCPLAVLDGRPPPGCATGETLRWSYLQRAANWVATTSSYLTCPSRAPISRANRLMWVIISSLMVAS